jgi:hypothetical protein
MQAWSNYAMFHCIDFIAGKTGRPPPFIPVDTSLIGCTFMTTSNNVTHLFSSEDFQTLHQHSIPLFVVRQHDSVVSLRKPSQAGNIPEEDIVGAQALIADQQRWHTFVEFHCLSTHCQNPDGLYHPQVW